MKGDFWVAETRAEEPPVPRKRKRRCWKRRIEFLGWGSKPLIEFLGAMGEDTSTQRTQHDVVRLINKYIEEKGLACPKMKRKVNCDDALYAIFRRKTILRAKVHNLLEEHYAENRDSSDEDSSDENGSETKKKVLPTKMSKAPERKPRSGFAAIVAENIKLVHLKKSLVEELLLKDPESFDSKLVGSFVRIKCDPNDIFQKVPFQLHLVTGIERIHGNGILLKVSNYYKDVPINMLSDANFEEIEVEDVRERIKDGSLKRLLLIEVEAKAQMLHHDITKHRIAKELNLLKHQIEHANIKGWRKQLWEYREKKKKLETPSEVEKMLNTMPEVIAEELQADDAAVVGSGDILTSPQVSSDDSHAQEDEDEDDDDADCTLPVENQHGSGDVLTSPQVSSDDSHAQKVEDAAADSTSPVVDQHGSVDILTSPQVSSDDSHAQEVEDDAAADSTLPVENQHGSGDVVTSPRISFDDSHAQKVENAAADSTSPVENQHGSGEILTSPRVKFDDSHAQKVQDDAAADSTSPVENQHGIEDILTSPRVSFDDSHAQKAEDAADAAATAPPVENQHADARIVEQVNHENPAKEVIDLSSDDDDESPPTVDRAALEWHYRDPWGSVRGPFTLNALKRWSDAKYFPSHFRIWKTGETLGDGVLLIDVLRRAFPS